jgi:hypothetical protein
VAIDTRGRVKPEDLASTLLGKALVDLRALLLQIKLNGRVTTDPSKLPFAAILGPGQSDASVCPGKMSITF